jgi:hypothetical protein
MRFRVILQFDMLLEQNKGQLSAISLDGGGGLIYSPSRKLEALKALGRSLWPGPLYCLKKRAAEDQLSLTGFRHLTLNGEWWVALVWINVPGPLEGDFANAPFATAGPKHQIRAASESYFRGRNDQV